MRKIVSLICVIVVMVTAIIPVNAAITCEQVHYPMYFNGTLVPEGDKPILSLNWNTYVPLRKVCEGTGLDVIWNNEKQVIYVNNTSQKTANDYMLLTNIYNKFDLIYQSYWLANEYLKNEINTKTINEHTYVVLQTIETYLDEITDYNNLLMGYETTTIPRSFYLEIDEKLSHSIDLYSSLVSQYNLANGYIKGIYDYDYVYNNFNYYSSQVDQALNHIKGCQYQVYMLCSNTDFNGGFFDYQTKRLFGDQFSNFDDIHGLTNYNAIISESEGNTVVFIDHFMNSYHKKNCDKLSNNIKAITLTDAEYYNFYPCTECFK